MTSRWRILFARLGLLAVLLFGVWHWLDGLGTTGATHILSRVGASLNACGGYLDSTGSCGPLPMP